jgi:type II secretory pathway component PulK
MKTRQPKRQNRGIALIIVMTIIVFLSVLAGGFALSMKVETKLARNQDDEADIVWVAYSGVELAKYVLGQQLSMQPQNVDALNQKWAGGVGITNDALADITLENNPLGPGFFSIKIIDQERKFNINAADNTILQQAMILLGVDASDSPAIIDSILDWRDPDNNPHLSGVETDYYLGLNPPYYAKNGPIDDISELLLINGITPELYGATDLATGVFSEPMTPGGGIGNSPALNLFASSDSMGSSLKELFCCISGPQININTAPAHVLQLLPGIDANIAAEIVRLRAGPDGASGNEDDVPFRTAGELMNVPGINRQAAGLMQRYFNTRSTTFEVQVEAAIGNYQRRYVAMLKRNSARDIQVLYFHSL